MKRILIGLLLVSCLFGFDVYESLTGVSVSKGNDWFQIDFVDAIVPTTNPSISFTLANGAFDYIDGTTFIGTSSNVTTMAIAYKQYNGGASVESAVFTIGTALTTPQSSFMTFTIPNHNTTPNIINGSIYGTIK